MKILEVSNKGISRLVCESPRMLTVHASLFYFTVRLMNGQRFCKLTVYDVRMLTCRVCAGVLFPARSRGVCGDGEKKQDLQHQP